MNNGLFFQKLKVGTYPFTSYYFYKHPNFLIYFLKDEENNELKINEKKDKENIIREIFDDIRQGFYTTKLDSIKMLIEKDWNLKCDYNYKKKNCCSFLESDLDSCCEDLLYSLNRRIAKKYFYLKNGKIYIDGSSNEKYLKEAKEIEFGESYNHKFEWYILKHLVNMDTVIGVFLSENRLTDKEDMSLWNTPIFSTESLLDKVLEKGLAELHMHVGATKRFSRIWMWMMNDVNSKKNQTKKDNILSKIKVNTLDGSIVFEHYIKVAEIIRILMASYITNKHSWVNSFEDYIDKFIDIQISEDNAYNKSFKEICNMFYSGYLFHQDETIFYKGKVEQLKKILNIKYEETNIFYDKQDEEATDRNEEKYDYIGNILREDILTYLFQDYYVYDKYNNRIQKTYYFDGIIFPEHILISKAIEKMKHSDDAYFKRIFWQYTKIKNIVYKYIVQQYTSGKGLDIFSEIYSRQSNISISNFIEEALSSQISNQNIRKLEIRTAPRDNEYALKKYLINILEAYKNIIQSDNNEKNFKNNGIPLLGIVFHFIKQKDTIFKDKCFHSYSKEEKKYYMHYGKLSEKYKNQAEIIAKIRSEIPELSNYIVGIDAASKENDTEPYVFRKAYEILRSINSIKTLRAGRESFVKDIGFTYHVGEEFRDIVSGLRHVDEVIEKLNFKSGDRLGHAIVVGLDIEKWSAINTVVYLPAGEYFENLLWEWGLYVNDENYKDVENISYLENRIYKMAEYIFGFTDGLLVRDLYKSYNKNFEELCNLDSMKDKKCKLKEFTRKKYYVEYDIEPESKSFNVDEITWNARTVYQAMHCEYFLKNINKTVAININRNLTDKYKKLQSYIKDKINKRGIIVETNPTSNLLIGDFATFEDYHITNLSSPNKEDVIITINTDDPVVFNTRIGNEFSLIYDILMKQGKYSNKEIIEWLDKVRENGLEYSFIKDRGLPREEIKEELEKIIEELKK